jgi:AhpD family alkylhydroperoxidase
MLLFSRSVMQITAAPPILCFALNVWVLGCLGRPFSHEQPARMRHNPHRSPNGSGPSRRDPTTEESPRGPSRAAQSQLNWRRRKAMKALIIALAFGAALPVSAFAQDAPPFVKAIAPQASVSPAWQEWMAVFNPKGALDGKTKELIGLAVAAQIPCQYCIYAHTLGAKHAGATDDQIKEAIAASGLVRKMSTELNGNQYDMTEFKRQIDAAYAGAKTE